MAEKEKQRSVWAIESFIESVACIVAATEEGREEVICRFPEPSGLGTDGTCWTDEEHRKHYLAVADTAKHLLRKAIL